MYIIVDGFRNLLGYKMQIYKAVDDLHNAERFIFTPTSSLDDKNILPSAYGYD
jgi:hypothetical protein